jgi:hypothetical protein
MNEKSEAHYTLGSVSVEDVEVIGMPPSLAQQVCDEVLCEQYWHGGELVAPANVCHFRFGDTWHRLTFDHGIIFWRQQAERPKPYTMPELDGETRIDNVGERLELTGRRLVSYTARAVVGGSEVAFSFEGGRTFTLRNVFDRTSCLE